jgi:hypothetical protein
VTAGWLRGLVWIGGLSGATFAFALPPLVLGDTMLPALMTDARLEELSGLAPHPRRDERLWALNDGGAPAILLEVDRRGRVQREVTVEGVQNIDWEDLDHFRVDGRSRLLIADTGDNARRRSEVYLHVVPVPPTGAVRVRPLWTLTLRYADGPQDVEAVAVHPASDSILLVSKRVRPSVLYRVPLSAGGQSAIATAVRLRELPELLDIPIPPGVDPGSNMVRFASQPTAMQFGCDGALWVLSYAAVFRFEAADWASAQGLSARRAVLPPLPQAEALSFDRGCRHLYIGTETVPSPLLRYRQR